MTADTRPVHSGSRRPCRRTLLLFLCLLTTLSALLSAGVLTAAAEEPPASTDVGVVLLLNLENNLTLYEKEADTNVYPSSSVKIMMGLLACRSLCDRLDEEVTVTAAMVAGVTGRSMHLADGEKLTIRDLLYAAMQYMSQNLTQPLSLRGTAHALGVNTYYLSHVLNERLEMGFRAYLNALSISIREVNLFKSFVCNCHTSHTDIVLLSLNSRDN